MFAVATYFVQRYQTDLHETLKGKLESLTMLNSGIQFNVHISLNQL